MRVGLVLFLVSLPAFLSAAPVIEQSTQCGVPTGVFGEWQGMSSTSNPCSLQSHIEFPFFTAIYNSNQSAQAHTSASYSLSGNTFAFDLAAQAYAYELSGAVASVTLTDTFTTAGPIRTGIIRGFYDPSHFRYGGILRYGIDFPGRIQYETFTERAPTMYITLGQPFTLTSYAYAETSSDDNTPSSADINAAGTYISLFEEDGVTPVALSEVAPEPASVLLGVVGLGGLALFSRVRKARS